VAYGVFILTTLFGTYWFFIDRVLPANVNVNIPWDDMDARRDMYLDVQHLPDLPTLRPRNLPAGHLYDLYTHILKGQSSDQPRVIQFVLHPDILESLGAPHEDKEMEIEEYLDDGEAFLVTWTISEAKGLMSAIGIQAATPASTADELPPKTSHITSAIPSPAKHHPITASDRHDPGNLDTSSGGRSDDGGTDQPERTKGQRKRKLSTADKNEDATSKRGKAKRAVYATFFLAIVDQHGLSYTHLTAVLLSPGGEHPLGA
jgi:hypothetical protein